MAFYYVKSGGTATGDAGRSGTKRTGSFGISSTYYASVKDANAVPTTPPVAGDVILCSNLHSFNNGGSFYAPTFLGSGVPIQVISVSDTAQDSYSAGAKEETNSQIDHRGNSSHRGMTYDASSWIGLAINNSYVEYKICILNLTSSLDFVGCSNDGCKILLVDCEIVCSTTSNGLKVIGGSHILMIGGKFTATSSIVAPCIGGAINGGGKIDLIGVDLTVANTNILSNHGNAATSDDHLVITVKGCKVAAGIIPIAETLAGIGTSILMINSSDTSASAEYQFYYQDFFGSAEDQDDSGIHRNESTAFGSGTKVSIKAITTANTSSLSPFSFDLMARFAALSNAATDTIRIYFVSTAALTDNDVWAELIYPDGTNKNLYTYLTNKNADPLAAGIAHIDDSGVSTWKNGGIDLTGNNEYRMDLNTSGNPGADSVPMIRVHVGKPSTTVYFDTTVDVVA